MNSEAIALTLFRAPFLTFRKAADCLRVDSVNRSSGKVGCIMIQNVQFRLSTASINGSGRLIVFYFRSFITN